MNKTAQRRQNAASFDLMDYPVREYVAAMAMELAAMARWDGDEQLAALLEKAAEAAGRTLPA